MVNDLPKLGRKQKDALLSVLLRSLGGSSSSSSSSSGSGSSLDGSSSSSGSRSVRVRKKLRIRKSRGSSERKRKRRSSSPSPNQGETSLLKFPDPVTLKDGSLAPFPPKKQIRCPFFFSLYGCPHGDDCNFWHFIPGSNDKIICDRNSDNTVKFIKVSRISRSNGDDLPETLFPLPGWGVTITLAMDVNACWVNRATEACLKQIGKSFSVDIFTKDHKIDANLKSVAIIGTVDQASKAFREICQLVSRNSSYYRLLLEAKPALYTSRQSLDFVDSPVQQRWPGQSVFRVLLPRETDLEACLEGFKSNADASLKMIKGNAQTVALVYAKEEHCYLSAALKGVMWLFDFLASTKINSGGKFSVELLVDNEQACQFFQSQVEDIERVCECTFAVYDTDGIGLQRDLILEVIEGVGDLREALSRTAYFFQRFSIHHSMIPVMEVVMDGSQMDYRAHDISSGSYSDHCLKDVVEYSVESYYVADALVGEGGRILKKIRNDTNTVIKLGEVSEYPGKLMVSVMEMDRGVLVAVKMVENLLNDAVRRTNEMLLAHKAGYSQEARYMHY